MALHVTVVYSPGARVVHERSLVLPDGATVEQALDACGWRGEVGQSGEGVALLGVWGRKVTAQQQLRDHDRVEIYRALTVDPKVARRARFVKQGARASGLFARRRPGAKAGY